MFHFLLGHQVARVASVASHVTVALQDHVLWSSLVFWCRRCSFHTEHVPVRCLGLSVRTGSGRYSPFPSMTTVKTLENVTLRNAKFREHRGQMDLIPQMLTSPELEGSVTGLAAWWRFRSSADACWGDRAEVCRPKSIATPGQAHLPDLASGFPLPHAQWEGPMKARGHSFAAQQLSWKVTCLTCGALHGIVCAALMC